MAYMGCHMYNENDDEIIKPAKDVFEINDFTAATEWENFIDDIENIFRNWKLSQSSHRVKVSWSRYFVYAATFWSRGFTTIHNTGSV